MGKAAIPRKQFSDKKKSGAVLIIGGSGDLHGAPILASSSAYSTIAALRAGAGYANLYVPASILHEVRALSPNIIVRPFGKTSIGQGHAPDLQKAILRADSLAIGMGIGKDSKTLRVASRIIKKAAGLGKKTVIDADAIYCIRLLKRLGKETVVTPHDREFAELYGAMPPSSLGCRIRAAASIARKLSVCILLKGHNTIITDGKRIKVVYSRHATLATMGTGDVLSGIISGYLAIGNEAFEAAVAGAYLHSRIGDLLWRKMGNHAIASDVIEEIPRMLKRSERRQDRKQPGPSK